MNIKTATALKNAWGDKPCDHETLEKEYFNDMATGDYICTKCGEAFTKSQRADKIKQEQQDKEKSQE